jgi:hypothetical protein
MTKTSSSHVACRRGPFGSRQVRVAGLLEGECARSTTEQHAGPDHLFGISCVRFAPRFSLGYGIYCAPCIPKGGSLFVDTILVFDSSDLAGERKRVVIIMHDFIMLQVFFLFFISFFNMNNLCKA